MPATLDENGLTIPTYEEIRAELEADLKAEFAAGGLLPAGAELNTTTGFLGRFISLMSEKIRTAYELLGEVYANSFADSAIGEALAHLATLSGTIPREATPSLVDCTLELDVGTYLAGTLVAHVAGDESATFENRDDITVTVGTPATVTGVAFVAQSTGPTVADSGTLTETVTVVTGWSDNTTPITNPLDASIGLEEESDEDLRTRRVVELARAGTGTVRALMADLSALEGMQQVIVLWNDTDVTDGNGLAPHSIECIVFDGTDFDDVSHTISDTVIAQTIWDNKGAGTATNGTDTGTAQEENGGTVTVRFSRPLKVTVHVEVDLEKDDPIYAGDAAVKSAIAQLAQEIQIAGADVFASRYYDAIHDVDGVVNVTRLEVSLSSPTSGSIQSAIDFREIADIQTANIDVTSTDF